MIKELKIIEILDKNKKRIRKSMYPASEVIDILNESNVFDNVDSSDYYQKNLYKKIRKIVSDWFDNNNLLMNLNNFI